MNKRLKKKLHKKSGKKCYRNITIYTIFKYSYGPLMKDLIYKKNPFLDLIPKDSYNLYHQPVVLRLKSGVTFSSE